MPRDVPSPIDLRDMGDAQEWEESALSKRPSRPDFFALYAQQIASHARPITRVLELGSGPGFLAKHLLEAVPNLEYTALDFSNAMHQLATVRFGGVGCSGSFHRAEFKDDDWNEGLGMF